MDPWQKLFLAMGYYRQGRAAEGRRLLEEAGRWVDRNVDKTLPPDSDLKDPLPWQMRLGVQLLRQEATRLPAVEARVAS